MLWCSVFVLFALRCKISGAGVSVVTTVIKGSRKKGQHTAVEVQHTSSWYQGTYCTVPVPVLMYLPVPVPPALSTSQSFTLRSEVPLLPGRLDARETTALWYIFKEIVTRYRTCWTSVSVWYLRTRCQPSISNIFSHPLNNYEQIDESQCNEAWTQCC